jgi:phosphatidylserine/phosphatidylglycerophosphate/cardiolipin synthase-like enzyme
MKFLIACMSLVLALSLLLAGWHRFKTLPDGISFVGARFVAEEVAFVSDATWVDANGQRHVEQAIFDDMFRIIAAAKKLIVLDMFLYNDFQGPVPETTRALASELTDALIAKKLDQPEINIVVISDPVNTLYGGLSSPYFNRLRAAGIRIVMTDLHQLRDSNIAYSVFWRAFIAPFGNKAAATLPNPIGQGRVSLRSYFELINFKANHRKVLVADRGSNYVGFVSSANPHDGSSAHRNAAIRFTGSAVADLIATENAVLALSGEPIIEFDQAIDPHQPVEYGQSTQTKTTLQVVTEGKIKEAILFHLSRSGNDDRVDLMMFYLSDREVIEALKLAQRRGANLRVLLDPNKYAFGRQKNGIPNRPVAHELTDSNIALRWCHTQGEQCHTKMLMLHESSGKTVLITGSANFTRRNLDDFNLETNVVVEGQSDKEPFTDAIRYFDDEWRNRADRLYSVDYSDYKDKSWWHLWLYRFMEWSGVSTF